VTDALTVRCAELEATLEDTLKQLDTAIRERDEIARMHAVLLVQVTNVRRALQELEA
jgi:hypothetical protein